MKNKASLLYDSIAGWYIRVDLLSSNFKAYKKINTETPLATLTWTVSLKKKKKKKKKNSKRK